MTPDLFTKAIRDLERENRRLKAENTELRMTCANLLAAARGAWHLQARVAKRKAINVLRAAA